MKKLWFIILLCCCACTPIIKQQDVFPPVMRQNIIFRNQLDITSAYYRSLDLPPYFMIRYDQLATFPNKARQSQINSLIIRLVESFSFSSVPKYSGVVPLIADHPIENIIVNATIRNTYNDVMELSLNKEVQLKDDYRIMDTANHYIHLGTGKELTINEIMHSPSGLDDLNILLLSSLEYVDPFEVEQFGHLYDAPFHKAFGGLKPGFSLSLNPDSLRIILNDSCDACYFPLFRGRVAPHNIPIHNYAPVIFDHNFHSDSAKYTTAGSFEFMFRNQGQNLHAYKHIDEPLAKNSTIIVNGSYPQYTDAFWDSQIAKLKETLFKDMQGISTMNLAMENASYIVHMNLIETDCITTLLADYYVYNETSGTSKRFAYHYRSDTMQSLQLEDLFHPDFDYNTFIRSKWEQLRSTRFSDQVIDTIMKNETYYMIYAGAVDVIAYYLDSSGKQQEARISFTIDEFGVENLADFIRNPHTQ